MSLCTAVSSSSVCLVLLCWCYASAVAAAHRVGGAVLEHADCRLRRAALYGVVTGLGVAA
jgi:hypothetical protein